MPQLGSYELLREISRSPLAVVYAARKAGDAGDAAGRYAVKAFDADSYGLLESVAAGQAFLERADVQRGLFDRGAKHWARVYESGDPDQPYYVTDLYPLTARKVIDRAAPVGVRGLYTVVWSVVRGLTELRETFRRAHGNLKLTNILIRGEDDLRTASPRTTEVALADPSVEATTARDRSADLLALGELIHQLVLRRPFAARPAADGAEATPAAEWPVPPTAAWRKLGPDADRWRDLCNWLLNPTPAERPADLVAVAVALHPLAPKPVRRAPRWAAAIAIPLAIAGAGAGLLYHLNDAARVELLAVDGQWFAAFERALDDPARVQRYAGDATLRAVADLVRQSKRDGVRFDPSGDPVISYAAYQNARAALAVVGRVERELSPDRWQRLASINALRQRYEARGWAQPAGYLADLARGATPSPGADLAAGIDRFVDVSGRIGADAIRLNEQWAVFETDLKAVRDAGDPVLATFAAHLRGSSGATLRLTDDGFDQEGLAAFAAQRPLAARLATVVANGFPSAYGRAKLADEVEARLNVANPADADVSQWLDAVGQYELVRLDPAAAPLAELKAAADKLAADVRRQKLGGDEQAAYAEGFAAVRAKLDALATERFVRKYVAPQPAGDIPGRVVEVRRGLDALRTQWVRLDDPGEWVRANALPLPTASDALKQRWAAYVDARRAQVDALAADPAAFKRAKARAADVKTALVELDKRFPAVRLTALSEPFADAAYARRERDLRALSEWAAGPDPAPPATGDPAAVAVDARGAAYADWTDKLTALGKDFPVAKELLSPADRPDKAWADKEPEFWADPLVQGLVKRDVERINAVAAVAKMSRAGLARTAAEAEPAEVVLAAWRRLGADPPPDGGPAWPRTETELAAEQAIRNRLVDLLNAVKLTDPDRKRAYDDWQAQGPLRWRRYANAAGVAAPGEPAAAVEQRLRAAYQYADSMRANPKPNLPPVEVDKLDPVPRFNYALYVARVGLTDPDAANRIASAAAERVRATLAGVSGRADVADLAKRLARVTVPEPMAADARLLATPPPDTFEMPAGDGPPLRFVRLAPPGGRAAYVCTTELSLGQFMYLVGT
ncbi:MAG: hypothetical protein JWO31_20, partial [Phycisphaerales bacterium]|nr:hypothetical protein [Phycisphaerales bacterium]